MIATANLSAETRSIIRDIVGKHHTFSKKDYPRLRDSNKDGRFGDCGEILFKVQTNNRNGSDKTDGEIKVCRGGIMSLTRIEPHFCLFAERKGRESIIKKLMLEEAYACDDGKHRLNTSAGYGERRSEQTGRLVGSTKGKVWVLGMSDDDQRLVNLCDNKPMIGWGMPVVRARFKKKFGNNLIVINISEERDSPTEVRFFVDSVDVFSDFLEDRFVEFVKEDGLVVEIQASGIAEANYSGKTNGRSNFHNHGTTFRIRPKNLGKSYRRHERYTESGREVVSVDE